MTSKTQVIHQMKGTQFPFGMLNISQSQVKKVLVKKRYHFKDQEQLDQLRATIEKLKTITHKNTINLRSAEQNSSSITLFYQYVLCSLDEQSFHCNPSQTVKDLHRQFIQLAIYLAKNCILTSFSPQRCGVIINDTISTIKYYLPPTDIQITDNRTTLERSVQLFNLQSMHYLDTIMNQSLNSTVTQSYSRRTFKNRVKLFHDQVRKESQQIGVFTQKDRKFSNNIQNQIQSGKLSSLSRQLTEINQIHKRNRASTRVSGGSFNTYQSILFLKSQKDLTSAKKSQSFSHQQQMKLKKCLSLNGIKTFKVQDIVTRSKRALQNLKNIRKTMHCFKQLYEAVKKIHQD